MPSIIRTKNLSGKGSQDFTVKKGKIFLFILLYNDENLNITLRLKVLSIVLTGVSTGLLFLLPFLLDSQGMGLKELFITTCSAIPALIIDYLLIDNKDIGRVKLLTIAICLGIIICFALFILKDNVKLFFKK